MEGIVAFVAKITGIHPTTLWDNLNWWNLLHEWPGYGPGGGSEFPKDAARLRAAELAELPGPRIYLGRRVAEAFR